MRLPPRSLTKLITKRTLACHCEERSDEAISVNRAKPARDCFTSLAMTLVLLPAQGGDLGRRIPEPGKDFLRVLAEPRCAAADLWRSARKARCCPGLAQPARR